MNGGTHPDDLLPLLANGSLKEPELRRVLVHIENCERCRLEYRFLQAVCRGAKEKWRDRKPDEKVWEELQNRIRRERIEEEGRAGVKRNPVWWRRLAMAASLAVVVEGAILGVLFHQRSSSPALYRPLGEEGGRGEVVFQVRFRQDATEGRIRRLLQQAGLEFAGGPGALGVYRLRIVSAKRGAVARVRNRLVSSDIVKEVRGP